MLAPDLVDHGRDPLLRDLVRTRTTRSTLRTVADTVVRRRLLAVSGVSQVTPIGGAERQFQVIAHPDRLRANSISLTELLDAVRGASQNTSAGIYTEGPQEYVLQAIGRVRTPEEIGESVVALRGERSGARPRSSRTCARAPR